MKSLILKTFALIFPLFLAACNQASATDQFDNRVFYNTENPSQQLAFFDGGFLMYAEGNINPNMSAEDLEDAKENPSDFEEINLEEASVVEVSDGEYEVYDGDTLVLTFNYNEDTNEITTNDQQFAEETAE